MTMKSRPQRISLLVAFFPFVVGLWSVLLAACGPAATAHPSTFANASPTGPDGSMTPTATAKSSPSPAHSPTPLPHATPTPTPVSVTNAKVIRVVASVQTGSNFNPLYIHASATCPSGTHLLSGGFESVDPPGATRDNTNLQDVPDSYPLDTMTWYGNISVSNPNSGGTFYVYANCLQASVSVTTTIVSSPVTPGGYASLTVACPAGTVVTGGGWGPNPNAVDATVPSGNGWHTLDPQQAYAVCTGLAFATGTLASATFPVPSALKQLTVPMQVGCPARQFLVGGGFVSAAPSRVLKLDKQTISPDGSVWQISVLNIDSVNTFNATVYAVCVWGHP